MLSSWLAWRQHLLLEALCIAGDGHKWSAGAGKALRTILMERPGSGNRGIVSLDADGRNSATASW
jgi:hypothetical protein